MADETVAFTAEVQVDAEPAKKGFKQVGEAAETTSKVVEREMEKTAKAIDPVKAAVNAAAATFAFLGRAVTADLNDVIAVIGKIPVAGVALAGAAKIAIDEFDRLANVADAADAIGITTAAYQQFAFALEQAGVKSEVQSAALTKFAEQANFASRGFGELFDALSKYDRQARQSISGVTDFGKQISIVANAVSNAAGEQRRGAIATAAFGKANAELTEFLRGGAGAIEEMTDKAEKLGLIVKDDDIRNAKEIKEKFDALSKTIKDELNKAMVELAPVIIKAAEAIEVLVVVTSRAIAIISKLKEPILDLFSSLDGQSTGGLAKSLEAAKEQLEGINAEIAKNAGNREQFIDPSGFPVGDISADLENRKQKVQQYIDDIQRIIETREKVELHRILPVIRDDPAFTKINKPVASEQDLAKGQAVLTKIEEDFLRATQQTTALVELEHQKRLVSLQKTLAEGQISYGDYVKAVAELEATATAKINAEALKRIKPLTDAISNDLSRAFDQFVRTGQLNFAEFARSMLADIAKVAFQMNVLQPLFGGGTTPGGGIVGNILAGAFHDGGMVGSGGASRMVPGYLFATAPRLHDGLKPDEFPAILQSGERVMSRREVANGGGGGNSTVVNVINQSGGEVRQERSRQGNVDYVRILIGKVKQDMADGGFDQTLRGRFATSVATGRR